jgi:hypothetical protein
MKYAAVIFSFIFFQFITVFAAQDSVSNASTGAGKNVVQNAPVVPAKPGSAKTLEEEDILVDEAEAKKVLPIPENAAEKKELAAPETKDTPAQTKNAGAGADSGKNAPVAKDSPDSTTAVSAAETGGAPIAAQVPQTAAPVQVESIRSINFAKNLKDYRSPKVAMFLSLLVPGLGQAYVKRYYKTGIFVALEATAIGFAVAFNSKGKDQATKAKSFADANYKYIKMKSYYDNLRRLFGELAAGESDADSSANAQINEIFMEGDSLKSFHAWSEGKSQEYYSIIEDPSSPYVQGWTDCQPPIDWVTTMGGSTVKDTAGFRYVKSDSAIYQVIRIDTANHKEKVLDSMVYGYSPNQLQFKSMMSKSNNYYKTAQNILFAMVINHVVSAVDALLSAKAYNDELIGKETVWRHISVDQNMVDVGSRSVPGVAVSLRF